jgi:hypothetical protein
MRVFFILALGLVLASCKVVISTPSTGEVKSLFGRNHCTWREPCVVEVNSTRFEDWFTPIANPGYAFTGWKAGEGVLCAGQTGDCELNANGLRGNDLLMSILESDEEFYLNASFAEHNRDAFNGDWYGELLGSRSLLTTEAETMSIQVSGSAIYMFEDRWGEDVTCNYNGFFDTRTQEGRYAREPISGTFECSTTPFTRGNFEGYVAAITDNQIYVELTTRPDSNAARKTVSVLRRNDLYIGTNQFSAAKLVGAPIGKRKMGIYEGNQVRTGPTCNDVLYFNDFSEIVISGEPGAMRVQSSPITGERCSYRQTNPNAMSGRYQCSTGASGNFDSSGIKTHKTARGTIVSLEVFRTGSDCTRVSMVGWKPGTVR